MPNYIPIRLSPSLELSISRQAKSGRQEVVAKLDRIQAQHLADALIQFSGGSTRSKSLAGDRGAIILPAVDVTRESVQPERGPVKIHRGSTYLR